MEEERIKSTIVRIPVSEIGILLEARDLWEGDDGGAHFIVSRHILPAPNELPMISLSISGAPDERLRLLREFKQVLGNPENGDVNLKDPDHVDMFAWLAD
jgi:hypothetical protein